MQNTCIPLDSDDVILLEEDAFKVSKFKQLVELQIQQYLNQPASEDKCLDAGVSILQKLSNLSLNNSNISLTEIDFYYLTECQVLKIGNPGWQQGKISIKVFISPLQPHTNQIDIMFTPDADDVEEYDTLLEDILKIVSES
jgi:hypothetical protein